MALHALASSQFPADAIEIIAFANLARRIQPHELPDLDANEVQGTNLQHALMLAGRFLDKHRDAEPVVLVVTDGEPTAHLDADGEWWFAWPPSAETIAVTVAEVDRMTRRGVPLSSSGSVTTHGWPASSTTSPAATAGACSLPRATGSATTSSVTTCAPVRDDAAAREPTRCPGRQRTRVERDDSSCSTLASGCCG